MEMEGFMKLYRKTVDWAVWRLYPMFVVFLDMIDLVLDCLSRLKHVLKKLGKQLSIYVLHMLLFSHIT